MCVYDTASLTSHMQALLIQYSIRLTKWDGSYTELSYATKQTSLTPATPLQTCMAVSESLLIISLHPWGRGGCILCVYRTNSVSRKIL